MADKPTKLPEWATDEGAAITEPSESKKQQGWEVEKPPHEFFNWWKNLTYKWVKYFADGDLEGDLSVTGTLSEQGRRLVPIKISAMAATGEWNNSDGGGNRVCPVNNALDYLPIPLMIGDRIKKVRLRARPVGGGGAVDLQLLRSSGDSLVTVVQFNTDGPAGEWHTTEEATNHLVVDDTNTFFARLDALEDSQYAGVVVEVERGLGQAGQL